MEATRGAFFDLDKEEFYDGRTLALEIEGSELLNVYVMSHEEYVTHWKKHEKAIMQTGLMKEGVKSIRTFGNLNRPAMKIEGFERIEDKEFNSRRFVIVVQLASFTSVGLLDSAQVKLAASLWEFDNDPFWEPFDSVYLPASGEIQYPRKDTTP